MIENELRGRVVAAAKFWLGCNEYDGTHRPIIDYYNAHRRPGDYCMTYTDPWCAAFSSAVGMRVVEDCALPCAPYELIPASAACDPKIAAYQRMDRWDEADDTLPKPGDEIFYDWQDSGAGDCTGSSDHVGIVVEVVGNTIKVIEGNKSDAVGYRTLQRDERYIRGFGRPDYARWAAAESQGELVVDPDPVPATDPTPDPSPTPAPGGQVFTVTLRYLRRGDKGEDVRAMQGALIARGCSCGRWGADGEFGNDTFAALRAFQHRNKLDMDGELGPSTAASLYGR